MVAAKAKVKMQDFIVVDREGETVVSTTDVKRLIVSEERSRLCFIHRVGFHLGGIQLTALHPFVQRLSTTSQRPHVCLVLVYVSGCAWQYLLHIYHAQ